MDLNGKVALITGAAGGIGNATLAAFARSGCTVVALDVEDENANTAVADLGPPHRSAHLDVTNATAWRSVVSSITGDLGSIDIVHLNAGVMTRPLGAPLLDEVWPWITEAGFTKVSRVNIDGVALGILACLPHMATRGGAIVVTASVAGISPLAADPFYTMSKHAVVGLVTALAPALATRNITINAVCPGGIDTGLVPPDLRAAVHQWASPSYIADAVVGVVRAGGTGQIWVAQAEDVPPWQYVGAPLVRPL